jgi:hypothetical protein
MDMRKQQPSCETAMKEKFDFSTLMQVKNSIE